MINSPNYIRSLAEEELRKEALRQDIDAEKIRLLQRKTRKTLWSRIFPFTITITRKAS